MSNHCTSIGNDTIHSMKGVLSLQAYNAQNELLWEKSDCNLIVATGYYSVAKAIAGVPDSYISKIAIGTNGEIAQETDLTITDVLMFDVKSVEYPKAVTVRFNFEIGYNEAVGMNIREFGLLTADERLFSRKVREAIEKTEHFRIIGAWDINICSGDFEIPGLVEYNEDYSDDYASADME